MDLPNWLDAGKIAGLATLIMAVVQYFKTSIPDKYIKIFAVIVGIVLAILSECYVSGCLITVIAVLKSVINGLLAALMADFGYGFLSPKAGSFTLPSKKDLTQPQKPEVKP